MSDPIPPQRTPEASGRILSAEELTRLRAYAAGYACCRRVRGDHEDCRAVLHDPADWCEPCITSRLLAHVEAHDSQLQAIEDSRARIHARFGERDADGECTCVYCSEDGPGLANLAAEYELDLHYTKERLAQAEAALYTATAKKDEDLATLRDMLNAADLVWGDRVDRLKASLAQSAERIQQLETALRLTRTRDEHEWNCRTPDCSRCADLKSAVVIERCAVLGDLVNPAALAGASPVPPQAEKEQK